MSRHVRRRRPVDARFAIIVTLLVVPLALVTLAASLVVGYVGSLVLSVVVHALAH